MKEGLRGRHNRTGFLTWHFTVDDHSIYQTLPTNETGEHADYEGQGNMSSIGIEMCVNRGNDLGSTIDRTAQLTARLMRQYNIPLDQDARDSHWRMIRYDRRSRFGVQTMPENPARWRSSWSKMEAHSSPKSHFMHDEVGNLSEKQFAGFTAPCFDESCQSIPSETAIELREMLRRAHIAP